MGFKSTDLRSWVSCNVGTADMDARLGFGSIGSGDVVRTGGVTVSVDAGEIGWEGSKKGGRIWDGFERFSALFDAEDE